ncbi:hypothetical protein M3Y94_00213700 [Aphelenchoides besseyi]|nr:hypothetical protein M3Y94_00213700 [Aphelenchoides besseyi]KAI6236598.1 Antigen peptide transporter 2 [Aphelenchoides besseyi]
MVNRSALSCSSSKIFFSQTTLFIALDLSVCVFFLGLMHPQFDFSLKTLEDQLLWRPHGFDLCRSAGEFVCLALIRMVLLVIGVILLQLQKSLIAFNHVVTSVFILSTSYSLLKILLYAEIDGQLTFWGVWLEILWTILASLLFFGLWTFRMRYQQSKYNVVNQNDATTSTPNEEAETLPVRLSTLRQIWNLLKYARYNGGYFYAGFFFLIIYAVARIFIPYFTGEVIAEVVKGKAQSSRFIRLVSCMFGLIMLSGACGGVRSGLFSYATSLVNRSMRKDLYRSILKQEIGFFDQSKTGEIISRLSSDCDNVSTVVSNNLNVLLRALCIMCGSLIFMAYLSWRLTLITAIIIPPLGFFLKLYGGWYDRLGEKTQHANAEANNVANEVISTMRTVRSFANEEKEMDRYEQHLAEVIRITQSKCIAEIGFTWGNDFAENVVLLSILFYAGHLAIHGLMTVNQITSFLLYQLQLGEVFYYLNFVFTSVMSGVGSSRKIFEYMNRKPAIDYNGTLQKDVDGGIEFDNIVFAYPTRPNFNVLKGFSLKIKPGMMVAIVGTSGGGKSTMISLLEHFYECASGEIRLDGEDICRYDHAFYHRRIALVAQEPTLYSTSIRENILYGLSAEDFAKSSDIPTDNEENIEDVMEAKMIEAAKMANCHEFVSSMSNGYDTLCGEKGAQLSGGQKQRIAIARALVRNPSVLLLDEATSALDSTSESLIQEAIHKCSKDRTVIIVAHRLSTVEGADLICVLNKGRVVQSGTHKELMDEEDGFYHSLVMRQMLTKSQD